MLVAFTNHTINCTAAIAMPAISLCMIVKNEEEVLARCLSSVRPLVDEIIIVDTGSSDRTVEIARSLGAVVYDFAWIDDFAAARNYSFSKATCPYILWLDADDVLKPEALDSLMELKGRLDKDVYYLQYDYAQNEAGASLCILYRERLIRNGSGIFWKYPIHECLIVATTHTSERHDIAVTHQRTHAGATADGGRNLRILEKAVATDQYRNDARICYYLAREYHDAGREHDAIREFRRFLAMPDGWWEDRVCAQQRIAKCLLALAGKEPVRREEYLQEARTEAKRARAMDARWAEPYFTLGSVAFAEEDFAEAVFWYEQCLRPAPPVMSPLDTWSYGAGPLVQLCLAHSRLGNHSLAAEYNERALLLLPDEPNLLGNRVYFANVRSEKTVPPEPVKLNLGAGNKPYLDYRSCDKFPGEGIDEIFSLDDIPYADGTVAAIYSEHALEHLHHHEARAALVEWFRVLAPGGEVILKLPDLAACCRAFLEARSREERDWYRYTIYGIQRSLRGEPIEAQVHRTGFTEAELVNLMESIGYTIDYHGAYDGYGTPSVEIRAHKPIPDRTVDIIIPTCSRPEYLHECVKSIAACTPHPHRVIVVDSGPAGHTDGLPADVTIIRSEERLNFSQALNLGIAASSAPYLCFMNDDVIVSHGWLEPLVAAVTGNVGVVNPLSNCDRGWLHDYDLSAAGMPLLPGQNTLRDGLVALKDSPAPGIPPSALYGAALGRDNYYERDWVAFFCTVLSRAVLDSVGRLDELFANGCEDLDYCRRAGRMGWRCAVAERSFVFHFGGTSRAARESELPAEYREEDHANNRRIALKYERPTLVIHTGHSYEPWTSRNIASGGIGGAETAAARMAGEFAALGYRAVVVSSCAGMEETIDGVEYLDYENFPAFADTNAVDVFVASRYISIYDYPIRAAKRYLWAHDIFALGTEYGEHDRVRAWYDRLDGIFVLSPWHREFFARHHQIPLDKLILTGNGIDAERFERDVPRQRRRFIYASSPDRGLETLLLAFPLIRQEFPDAELHVFYGFDNWNKSLAGSTDTAAIAHRDRVMRLLVQPGVAVHGRVGQQRLAEEFLRSEIWFYPANFTETYCISALEAQMAGVACVCTDLAALSTTVGDRGVLIPGDPHSREFLMRSLTEVFSLLRDDERRLRLTARGREWARQQTWSNRALQWKAIFED